MINMINKKTILSFLSVMMFLSCNSSSKTAGAFISNLNNATRIIIFFEGKETPINITDEQEIKYFLSTFMVNADRVNIENTDDFVANGYINILRKEENDLRINFDLGKGYHVILNRKEYYEKFTYLTGRYLSEIQ